MYMYIQPADREHSFVFNLSSAIMKLYVYPTRNQRNELPKQWECDCGLAFELRGRIRVIIHRGPTERARFLGSCYGQLVSQSLKCIHQGFGPSRSVTKDVASHLISISSQWTEHEGVPGTAGTPSFYFGCFVSTSPSRNGASDPSDFVR